jgi:hypothetical protein
MPIIARMFRKVPLAISRPAWTGTTTVRPSGWRITWWLPLILATGSFKRSDRHRVSASTIRRVLKAGAEGSSGAGAGLRYDVAEIPAYAGFDPTGRYE